MYIYIIFFSFVDLFYLLSESTLYDLYIFPYLLICKGKGKAIPLQAWTGPEGSRRLRLPDFMKVVRLSALRTGRLYPQEIFLVLISVRG